MIMRLKLFVVYKPVYVQHYITIISAYPLLHSMYFSSSLRSTSHPITYLPLPPPKKKKSFSQHLKVCPCDPLLPKTLQGHELFLPRQEILAKRGSLCDDFRSLVPCMYELLVVQPIRSLRE